MKGPVLAGDVGGTKTTLGIFEAEGGLGNPLREITYASRDFTTFEAVVREFLRGKPDKVEHACFGVAGPVVGGEVKVTNLPWELDEKKISSELGISSVRIINDLQATAYAIPHLPPSDFRDLNESAKAVKGGPIAVIAPGTGLGEAYLTWDAPNGGSNVHASEGGHADFAPRDILQIGLLKYLLEKEGHVSYESVCSGLGVRNVHTYLEEVMPQTERSEGHRRKLEAEEDPVPIIAKVAMSDAPECDACVKTFEIFVSVLGAEAGNLALRILATGGVYIGGGIPPKILPLLSDGRFIKAFRSKGRLSGLVSEIPVGVVLNPRAAFFGAARFGIDLGRLEAKDDAVVQEEVERIG